MQTRKAFVILPLVVLLGVARTQAQVTSAGAQAAADPSYDSDRSSRLSGSIQLSPEMQKLSDAFVGKWKVTERCEVSASMQGKARQGTASFRVGPGASLIEDYESNGSAGPLSFFGLLWWDPSGHVYRLLTCANNDGCHPRGSAKWEGNKLVNSWEEKVDGKPATFRDSFVDILPSSFRLVSKGTVGGKMILRVITKYRRLEEGK